MYVHAKCIYTLIMQIKEFFFIYMYFLAVFLHILMIDVYKTTSSSEKKHTKDEAFDYFMAFSV